MNVLSPRSALMPREPGRERGGQGPLKQQERAAAWSTGKGKAQAGGGGSWKGRGEEEPRASVSSWRIYYLQILITGDRLQLETL